VRLQQLLVGLLLVSAIGCGSATDPDTGGVTTNGCFAIVGNRGSITASIAGLSNFAGIIPTGSAAYIPATSVTPATFTIQATDVRDGTSVLVGGPVATGATTSGLTNANTIAVQILVTTRSCTAGTGQWVANSTFGTATVNLSTASSTSVAGSFTGTVNVSPGTSSVGSKTISGSFQATF
jgi:hypothetical protein